MRDALNTTDAGALLRESNSFVRDVMRQYTQDGWMSEAQYTAVHRCMYQAGWRLLSHGEGEENEWVSPTATAAATANVGEPATLNGAADIPNGMFTVTLEDEETWQFRIVTIRQARAESLINKRVIAYRAGTEWINFAFLTDLGRLKVWRRFESSIDDEVVLYGRMLLSILRQHQMREMYNVQQFTHPDPVNSSAEWHVVVANTTCRYCNGDLDVLSDISRGHDACARWRRFSGEYNEPTPPPRSMYVPEDGVRIHMVPEQPDLVASNSLRGRHAAGTVAREVHTYSELGSGWEQ